MPILTYTDDIIPEHIFRKDNSGNYINVPTTNGQLWNNTVNVGEELIFYANRENMGWGNKGIILPSDMTPGDAGITGVWEYPTWDNAANNIVWKPLPDVVDGTNGCTQPGALVFDPTKAKDWASSISYGPGYTYYEYFYRFRVTQAANLSTPPSIHNTPVLLKTRNILIDTDTVNFSDIKSVVPVDLFEEIYKDVYVIKCSLHFRNGGTINDVDNNRGLTILVPLEVGNPYFNGCKIATLAHKATISLIDNTGIAKSSFSLEDSFSNLQHVIIDTNGAKPFSLILDGVDDFLASSQRFKVVGDKQVISRFKNFTGRIERGNSCIFTDSIFNASNFVIIFDDNIEYFFYDCTIEAGTVFSIYLSQNTPTKVYLIDCDVSATNKLAYQYTDLQSSTYSQTIIYIGNSALIDIKDGNDNQLIGGIIKYSDINDVVIINTDGIVYEKKYTVASGGTYSFSTNEIVISSDLIGRKVLLLRSDGSREMNIVKTHQSDGTGPFDVVNAWQGATPNYGDKIFVLPNAVQKYINSMLQAGEPPTNEINYFGVAIRRYGYAENNNQINTGKKIKETIKLTNEISVSAPDATTALAIQGISIDTSVTPPKVTIDSSVAGPRSLQQVVDHLNAWTSEDFARPEIVTAFDGITAYFNCDLHLAGNTGYVLTGDSSQKLIITGTLTQETIHHISTIPIQDTTGTTSNLAITGVNQPTTVKITVGTTTLVNETISSDKVYMLAASQNGQQVTVETTINGITEVHQDTASGTYRELNMYQSISGCSGGGSSGGSGHGYMYLPARSQTMSRLAKKWRKKK